MTSVDANIVTGQHDTELLERGFARILRQPGDNLDATAYDDGIFQININPGDIGKTDPTALTITGTQQRARACHRHRLYDGGRLGF